MCAYLCAGRSAVIVIASARVGMHALSMCFQSTLVGEHDSNSPISGFIERGEVAVINIAGTLIVMLDSVYGE